jgi:hypothetical protein
LPWRRLAAIPYSPLTFASSAASSVCTRAAIGAAVIPFSASGHVSAGGDVVFLSMPMMLEDHAAAAARVLGEFVNAREVQVANPGP